MKFKKNKKSHMQLMLSVLSAPTPEAASGTGAHRNKKFDPKVLRRENKLVGRFLKELD